jgi:plastocyanin
MRRTILMALLCSLAICTTAFAGSITGKITYDGNVPKLRLFDMRSDPACAARHGGGKTANQMLVLGDGNALANVFVHVKNAPAGNYKAPRKAVTIDQKGCIYIPRVVGVMAGQPLQFKNSDGILHNVHGLPKRNREFNIGMPPSLEQKTISLNKPEPMFKVQCDFHPWMSSYVAVMTHPYFAVTGLDGSFEIDNVPDGTYQVEAWHEYLPARKGTATVSGGTATVDFTFRRSPRK